MLVEQRRETINWVTPQGAEKTANLLVASLLNPKEHGFSDNSPFYACLKTALLDDKSDVARFAYPLLRAQKGHGLVLGLIGEVATIRTLRKAFIYVIESDYNQDTVEKVDCFVMDAPVQIKTTKESQIPTSVYMNTARLYDLALSYLNIELFKLGRSELFVQLRAESSALISSFGTDGNLPATWHYLKNELDTEKKGKVAFLLRLFNEVYTLEQLKKRHDNAMLVMVNAGDINWNRCELKESATARLLVLLFKRFA
jgi:hypothetical protein